MGTYSEKPVQTTRRRIAARFLALAVACASGCARVTLVPEGALIRIGPSTSARVYVYANGAWELSENRVPIPEGWYIVPPSFVEEADNESKVETSRQR